MEKIPSPRSVAKHAAILDAAQMCFAEQGFSKTSMDSIAARAGVSKATIYAHFQSKDELFGAIIQRRCNDYGDGIGCLAVPQGCDGRQALIHMARHLLTFLVQPEVLAIYRMVVAESSTNPDLARSYYDLGPTRGKAHMAALLHDMMQQGLIPKRDAEQMTDQLAGLLRGEYYNRAVLGLPQRPGFDLETTVTGAVDLLLGRL